MPTLSVLRPHFFAGDVQPVGAQYFCSEKHAQEMVALGKAKRVVETSAPARAARPRKRSVLTADEQRDLIEGGN